MATPAERTRHAASLLLFAAATAVWMWPVLQAPAAAIPGAGAGDNLLFVWNLWWTKRSLLAGVWPLWCPMLFAPYGVDLTLHTHTLLPTALAGPFVRDAVAGTNAIICAHLFLNFVTGYALAWRLTRDWPAALLGALLVGWSPYVGERLLGHFNLIAVWVFPLTALVTLGTLEGARRRTLFLGLALAGVAYLEYYYAVYAAALVIVFLAAHVCAAEPRQSRPVWLRTTLGLIGGLIAVALLVAVIVLVTGGTVLRVAGATISLRSAGNPIAAAWLLSIVAGGLVFAARMRLLLDRRSLRVYALRLAPAVAIAGVLTLPLAIAGARMWMQGDYVSQRYLWRSAPKGIDLATLALGNPRGAVSGERTLAAYGVFGIDDIEQTAWLSPAALALCAIALYFRRRDHRAGLWIWTSIVFFIWALGPYVVAFGRTVALPLPAILLRYVPIVANARIPARAIVIVYLGVAVLAAMGVAALRERGRARWAAALALLTLVDILPARPPLFAVERPPLYEQLRSRPEDGTVLELPFGLRDGFGETGRFDALVLWHQTLHRRPIAGGFVARLPPRIANGYLESPIFGPLLRLSTGSPPDAEPLDRDAAVDALQQAGIRFIVLDRSSSPPGLIAFVRHLRLTPIADDGRREALLVTR